MSNSPISNSELLVALTTGQFKPMDADDRMAFEDAGDDAMIWFPKKKGPDGEELCVIVCTSFETLVVEVYQQALSDKNACWQGVLDFNRIN